MNKDVLKKLKEWKTSPLKFVTECIGATPSKQQARALALLPKTKRLTIRSGHGCGKDALSAWTIFWFMTTRAYAIVACTAPTAHQLSDILWSELSKWLRQSKVADEFIVQKDKMFHKQAPKEWWARAISPSAKATKEEQAEVKHYLVDEIDPRDEFSAAEYCSKAKSYISSIMASGKQPIISGGTGLYINTLIYDMDFSGVPEDKNLRKELENLADSKGSQYIFDELRRVDPKAAETMHANNVKRVIRALEINRLTGKNMASFKRDPIKTKDYDVNFICLNRDRDELYDRINRRKHYI